MANRTIVKVDATHAPKGPEGQRYLVSGRNLSMRLWQNQAPDAAKAPIRRDYETIGFVLAGRAELRIDGQVVRLEPGASWLVPRGVEHSYRILEPFTAIEATHPPAEAQARDHPPAA